MKGKLKTKLKICNTLGLSSLRKDLENDLIEDIQKKEHLKFEIEKTLADLIVAYEYNLDSYLSTFMAKSFHLISVQRSTKRYDAEFTITVCDKDVVFLNNSLPKEIAYELVKNSIKIIFHEVNKDHFKILQSYESGYAEMLSILIFFDQVFYDDNVIDVLPKNKKGQIFKRTPYQYRTSSLIGKITCAEDFIDRATLIVEDKRIHVKSFVLTDNSPVFKAMLQSTSFKEGQTKTIELPGKSLDEIVHFLEFLLYPKKIDGKSIWLLSWGKRLL